MANEDLLKELIYLGREHRALEYKQSMPWEQASDKIIKTAMAMANLRDGGSIVFGVVELGNGLYEQRGITPEDFATFDPDTVQEAINKFADPFVRVDFFTPEINGRRFVVINVYPFDEIPVVCKRTSSKFQDGDIYVRSNRKPETCKIKSQTEMRELIELALDKVFRKFAQRLHSGGVLEAVSPAKKAQEQFDEQVKGL